MDPYGKAFHLARADLIDDNLIGILNEIPMVIGNDSSKGIADTVFSTHAGMSATMDLFGAGNTNLSKDVLGFNGLASAVTSMRTQKDLDGRIVRIQPSVLEVPAPLEFPARQRLNSAELFRDQTTDLQPSGNLLQGINLQLAIEP